MGVFKVTAAIVSETKRGYKVFKLQLNKEIWVTKLLPLNEKDKDRDGLYQYYVRNESISFLVGRYIEILFGHSDYGYEFYSILSFDVIKDFKVLLDNSNGKAFSTRMDMYSFLVSKNYHINADSSITLNPPYEKFDLSKKNICYPNYLSDDVLNMKNIEFIFNSFYKNLSIETNDLDRDEKYVLTPLSIAINSKRYHKYKSKTLSDITTDVLRIGDTLSNEHIEFLKAQIKLS